jgi:uncharacterized protein YkwD
MRLAGDAFGRRGGGFVVLALALGCTLLGTMTAQGATNVTPGTRCRGALTLPTHSNQTLIDGAVTCLIGRERARLRVPALRANPALQGIATSLAREMASHGYFGDDTMTGQTPWQRIASSPYAVGARVVAAGQNIGWGTGGLATPQGVVEEWMHSAPHRLILLSSGYRDVGAGVAPIAPSSVTDERPGATYTVEFAARG